MDKERYWSFLIYPESAPENWKEILQETGLQIAISPIHDKDINPNGELKKPHYHIILFFPGPTTYNRVYKITQELNQPIPKRVISPIGMIRYLTHKDNPEKYQYDEKDIITINGLDIADIDGITKSMKEEYKRAILKIIKNNKIIEYSEIIDYLDKEMLYDMLQIASENTIFFNTYLTSKRHAKENN